MSSAPNNYASVLIFESSFNFFGFEIILPLPIFITLPLWLFVSAWVASLFSTNHFKTFIPLAIHVKNNYFMPFKYVIKFHIFQSSLSNSLTLVVRNIFAVWMCELARLHKIIHLLSLCETLVSYFISYLFLVSKNQSPVDVFLF